MKRTFEHVTSPLGLDLRMPAGSIAVDAEDITEVEVELEPLNESAGRIIDAVTVDLRTRGGEQVLLVDVPDRGALSFLGRSPEFDLRVRCPDLPAVRARSGSADFEGRGAFASLELKTASGDTEVARVDGDATVQTASGDVSIGFAGGSTTVQTASGDVTIDRAERPLRVQLVSGDLTVRDARESVEARTVSGDLALEAVASGSIVLVSVSGDIRVGVRKGANVWMDVRSVSGETTSDLTPTEGPPSDDAAVVELRIKSVSGDVQIESAAPATLDA
jgi:hypothetical protein